MSTARRLFVAGACLASGAGVVWLVRDNAPNVPAADAISLAPSTVAVPTPPEPPRTEPIGQARVEELRALSETYRATTFLTAIRAAGYVCYELTGVYGGLNDSATWTVNCADMLAYTIRVDAGGGLVIEPTAQYLDSPATPRDGRPPEPALPLPR